MFLEVGNVCIKTKNKKACSVKRFANWPNGMKSHSVLFDCFGSYNLLVWINPTSLWCNQTRTQLGNLNIKFSLS